MDEASFEELRAKYLTARRAFQQARQQCAYLQMVVRAKQEVIEELLPYYPYPLSRELQAKIFLA